MTDKDFVLKVLSDGRPASQSEILFWSIRERGCGLTVHSRVADLRRDGYVVSCEYVPGKHRGEKYVYRLVSSPLKEAEVESRERIPSAASSGQLSLEAAA